MHLSKNKLDHMLEIPKKSYVVTIVSLQSIILMKILLIKIMRSHITESSINSSVYVVQTARKLNNSINIYNN